MKDLLKHRGYFGTIQYSEEDDLLIGKVVGIRDSITYHGDTLAGLKRDFQEAIDYYLETCEAEGLEPDATNLYSIDDVQISPVLIQQLAGFSRVNNKTPNQAIEEAIKTYIMA